MTDPNTDTIFSKIIRREIPATIVYEDAVSLACMDLHPVSKGHLLLVSKEPYMWVQDVPDALLADMFTIVKKLIISMKSGLGCDYVQVVIAGDEVPHFHIHLIPRHHGEKIFGDHRPEVSYSENELQNIADKIKTTL